MLCLERKAFAAIMLDRVVFNCKIAGMARRAQLPVMRPHNTGIINEKMSKLERILSIEDERLTVPNGKSC